MSFVSNARSFVRPMILFAFVIVTSCQSAVSGDGVRQVQFVSSLRWQSDEMWFGGLSGLEVSQDGSSFMAISDRGRMLTGDLTRKDGELIQANISHSHKLRGETGASLPSDRRDAEGLAITSDKSTYISFEGTHRVVKVSSDGITTPLPAHPDFANFQLNSSLEALASDEMGALYTLPERSGGETRPFPIYKFDGTAWSIPFHIARVGAFLPVGADIGPDGALYLLERDFKYVGFKSRVRRFDLTETGTQKGDTILQTALGHHDNLEAISVWRDEAGHIRLTLLSDDNFRLVQVTELVEYAIAPQ